MSLNYFLSQVRNGSLITSLKSHGWCIVDIFPKTLPFTLQFCILEWCSSCVSFWEKALGHFFPRACFPQLPDNYFMLGNCWYVLCCHPLSCASVCCECGSGSCVAAVCAGKPFVLPVLEQPDSLSCWIQQDSFPFTKPSVTF